MAYRPKAEAHTQTFLRPYQLFSLLFLTFLALSQPCLAIPWKRVLYLLLLTELCGYIFITCYSVTTTQPLRLIAR